LNILQCNVFSDTSTPGAKFRDHSGRRGEDRDQCRDGRVDGHVHVVATNLKESKLLPGFLCVVLKILKNSAHSLGFRILKDKKNSLKNNIFRIKKTFIIFVM